MGPKQYFLIAEDDPDDQFLIQEALEQVCSSRLEARFVSDGVELLNALQDVVNSESPKPSLVLVDLNLPCVDGRTAIQEIKADPELSNIPLAVLTGSNHPGDIEFCQKNGVAYYRKTGAITGLQEIAMRLCMDFLS